MNGEKFVCVRKSSSEMRTPLRFDVSLDASNSKGYDKRKKLLSPFFSNSIAFDF